jgi:putative phosphoesterase
MPTRVAVLADVHGNRFALDAVLTELERDPVDDLVCLGDVAVGPQATAVLERVRALNCRVTMGNWDAWSLDGMPEFEDEIGMRLAELGAWWAEQLSDSDRRYIRSFESTVELELDGGTKLFCFHGSPRSFDDVIQATTPDEELEGLLAGVDSEVIAAGHSHLQMVRRHRGSIVFNPGSIGMAFQPSPRTALRAAPWAEYGIVCSSEGSLAIELRRTSYDLAGFLRTGLESGMPHAEWWASAWIAE